MKNLISTLVLLAATSVFADYSSDSYLYWMIDSDVSYSWTYAKARVGSGDSASYLTIGVEGDTSSTATQITSDAYDSDFSMWAALAGQKESSSIVIELYNDSGYLAESDGLPLSSGAAEYIAMNRMALGGVNTWTATNFHIPEPNSALLMLIGAAMLGLKRKRAKKA